FGQRRRRLWRVRQVISTREPWGGMNRSFRLMPPHDAFRLGNLARRASIIRLAPGESTGRAGQSAGTYASTRGGGPGQVPWATHQHCPKCQPLGPPWRCRRLREILYAEIASRWGGLLMNAAWREQVLSWTLAACLAAAVAAPAGAQPAHRVADLNVD